MNAEQTTSPVLCGCGCGEETTVAKCGPRRGQYNRFISGHNARLQGSTEERLLAKIKKLPGGCWQWVGAIGTHGYGRFRADGKTQQAHRVSYTVHKGPIPAGLDLDHLCRNRGCVNPDHLEPVTRRENLLRGETFTAANAAKTHCPQGHPYDEENTMIDSGGRKCKICNREKVRRYEREKKAAR